MRTHIRKNTRKYIQKKSEKVDAQAGVLCAIHNHPGYGNLFSNTKVGLFRYLLLVFLVSPAQKKIAINKIARFLFDVFVNLN